MEVVQMPISLEANPNTNGSMSASPGKDAKSMEKLDSPFGSMMKEKLQAISNEDLNEQKDGETPVEDLGLKMPVMMAFLQGMPQELMADVDGEAMLQQLNTPVLMQNETKTSQQDIVQLFEQVNGVEFKLSEEAVDNENMEFQDIKTGEKAGKDTTNNEKVLVQNITRQSEVSKTEGKPLVEAMNEGDVPEENEQQTNIKTDNVINSKESIKQEKTVVRELLNHVNKNDGTVKTTKEDAVKTTKEDAVKPDVWIESVTFKTDEKVETMSLRLQENHTVQREEIITKLAEKFRIMVTENRSEVNIQLKPASLGRINLKLEMVDGVLNGKIVVQNAGVRETVESNLTHLRNSLEQQGITVNGFSVDVRGGREFSQQQFYESNRHPVSVKSSTVVYQENEEMDLMRWNDDGTINYLA